LSESPSYAYYEFLERISDRLSYGENHPERKKFHVTLEKVCINKGYEYKKLHELTIPIDEKVVPIQDCPDEIFNYLGLEDIESDTGRASPKLKTGKEILTASKRFYNGNIVFAGLRPYLNKVHLVQIDEGIGSAELFVIQPRKELVMPEYLVEYLLSDLVLTQTKWILTGCGYPRLAWEDFKDLRVICPTKAEQDELVRKTTMLRQDMEMSEKRMNNLIQHFQNLIPSKLEIEMPCDKRFDYFSLYPSERSEERLDFAWNRPWLRRVEELLDTSDVSYLGNYLKPKIESGVGEAGKEEGSIPILNIENLKLDGRIHKKNLFYVDDAPKHKLLTQEDFLVSRTRDAGICVLVTEGEKGFTFSQNVLRFNLKEDVNCVSHEYIVAFLNSWLGQAQIERWKSGSAGTNINTKKVPKIRIMVPKETSFMDKITQEVRQLWREMDALDLEIETKMRNIRHFFANYWQISVPE